MVESQLFVVCPCEEKLIVSLNKKSRLDGG